MTESKFQFLNPYLEEVSFHVNTEFDGKQDGFSMKNSFQVQVQKSETETKAIVALLFETNSHDDTAPFQIRAKVASEFIWEKDLDEKEVEALLNCNAPALLLSYMRPIVANLTNSSAFPAYNLPFINFSNGE